VERRDLLTLLPPEALERSGGFRAFPVFEQDLLASGGDLIVCWGIFNPFGPTFSCFGRLRTQRTDVDLLFYRMLNPFRQDGFIVTSLVGSDRTDAATVARTLEAGFRDNWIATLGSEPVYLIGNGAPSFVVCPWEDPAFQREVPRLFVDSPAIRGCDLAKDMDDMRRHPRRPWDRAAEQRDRGFAALLKMRDSEAPPKLAREGRASSLETAEAWYQMVAAPEHYLAELAAFPRAWAGAIEHCGAPEMQKFAYSMERVNAFLAAFRYPVFEWIAEALRTQSERGAPKQGH
jgi:hypothetical protein